MVRSSFLAVSISALLLSGTTFAQGSTATAAGAGSGTGETAPSANSSTDTGTLSGTSNEKMNSTTTFVHRAAKSGMMEVHLSKKALATSENSSVKELAQQMVTDHEAANKELMSLVKSKGITPPGKGNLLDHRQAEKVTSQSGAAFDKAYVTQLQKDHEKAVDLFKTAAADKTLDPDVSAFARKTLPTLQGHLTHVQDVQAKLGT